MLENELTTKICPYSTSFLVFEFTWHKTGEHQLMATPAEINFKAFFIFLATPIIKPLFFSLQKKLFQKLLKVSTELNISNEKIILSQLSQPLWLWAFSPEYATNPVTITPVSANSSLSKKHKMFTSSMQWSTSFLTNCNSPFLKS